MVDIQLRAFEASFAGREGLRDEVIELDGRPVGRIITAESHDPFDGIDFAVDSSVRGQGIGAHVFAAFVARADAAGAAIVLRVLHGNPAERLYRRAGFVAVESSEFDTTMRRVSTLGTTIG